VRELPKDTFYNLPPDKRQKIEDAALREFSGFNFDQASINRIIELAGIPKGSFYQYFQDKKDLYRHLLDLIVSRKLEFLSPVAANPDSMDFFTLIHEIYAAGIRFAAENPQLQMISRRLLSDRSHPVFVEFMQDNMSKSDEIFAGLIRQGISRGEIRQDIDVDFVAHLVSSINSSVADYYQEHINVEIGDDYLQTVDKLIDFLKRGIGDAKSQRKDERK
jgi:AcrR family transcriptional regulator